MSKYSQESARAVDQLINGTSKLWREFFFCLPTGSMLATCKLRYLPRGWTVLQGKTIGSTLLKHDSCFSTICIGGHRDRQEKLFQVLCQCWCTREKSSLRVKALICLPCRQSAGCGYVRGKWGFTVINLRISLCLGVIFSLKLNCHLPFMTAIGKAFTPQI